MATSYSSATRRSLVVPSRTAAAVERRHACCTASERATGSLATIPAVEHPVPDRRHRDGRGESLGTFEALNVVEMRGLFKVNVPQGRLDSHHQLARCDVECHTTRVCLVHEAPVLAHCAL